MIVKSSRRAGTAVDARDLLQHLLHGEGNESVMEVSGPGFLASLIDDARLVARDTADACWHLSVSPSLPLSTAQWERVDDVVRDAYNLSAELPMACVQHLKPHRAAVRDDLSDRAAHRHYAFPTTDPVTGRKINSYRHYTLNERIARQLEHEFEHPFVKGRHNVSVAKFARANGMQELAVAMHEAGLLDGAPPRQRVSDGERRVGQRRSKDPFLAVDSSDAVLATVGSAPSPAIAYVRGMLDAGFIVARGERGLVLVPIDGGRAVGAARKAGLTETALHVLVADEIDRLPTIAKGADVKTWLASHAAAYNVNTLSPDGVMTEEPDHGETDTLAGTGSSRHRTGHDPFRGPSRDRQQGHVASHVRHDHAATAADSLLPLRELLEPPEGEIPPAADTRSAAGRRRNPKSGSSAG